MEVHAARARSIARGLARQIARGIEHIIQLVGADGDGNDRAEFHTVTSRSKASPWFKVAGTLSAMALRMAGT